MTGESLRIVVDPSIKPFALHKLIPVPLHWRDGVKNQLDNDCKMGVIEPVPPGTPITRMHKNGGRT